MKNSRGNIISILAVILAVSISGCATGMPRSGMLKENDYKSMKANYGLDNVYVEPGVKFGDYKVVRLMFKESYDKSNKAANEIAYKLKARLRQQLRNAGLFNSIIEEDSAKEVETGTGGKELVLKIAITRIDMGSQMTRFIIGFGAGSTNVALEGEAVDTETGKRLMYFSESRYGYEYFGVQSSESLVDDDSKVISDNIVKILTDNR